MKEKIKMSFFGYDFTKKRVNQSTVCEMERGMSGTWCLIQNWKTEASAEKNTTFCETISASKHLFSIQIVLGQVP